MSGVQTYEKLQQSDVEWIGNIPNHWELLPARTAVTNLMAKNEGALDQNYLSLVAGQGVIPYADKGDMGNKKPDDLSKCKLVTTGNLVINSMNYFIGSYGMSAYDGVCSPVYIVLEIHEKKIDPRFALRVFANVGFQKYLATFGNGILAHRAAIGWDDIKGAYIPTPPIKEQNQIAAFLDYETAKIDALIEKQQQLIALLGEKRQAVISHAVTKGLNPNAPMRDSGVEWLGEVPAHWVVARVKTGITQISQGWSPQCHNTPASEDEWGVLKVGCCNKFDIDTSEQKRLPSEIQPVVEYEIKNEDIVMSRGNTLDLVGMAALVKNIRPKLLLSDLTYRFRVFKHIYEPAFLVHSLRANHVRSQIECSAVGSSSTMKKVSQELVRNLVVCQPPIKEQQAISERLAIDLEKLDTLITNSSNAVKLLTERRAALISLAVTGKIDVRNWKPPTDSKPQKTDRKAA